MLNIPQYSGGGGGSGTVNSGTAGQIAVYPSNGTAVSGTSTPVIPTVVATYGSTTNFDLSQSNNQQVTLAGNPTLALSNVTAGQRFTLNLIQDGTGSRTVTWFGGIAWAGGSAPTLQTAPGTIDAISFWCVSPGVYQGYPASAPVPGTSGQIPHNNGTALVGSANAHHRLQRTVQRRGGRERSRNARGRLDLAIDEQWRLQIRDLVGAGRRNPPENLPLRIVYGGRQHDHGDIDLRLSRERAGVAHDPGQHAGRRGYLAVDRLGHIRSHVGIADAAHSASTSTACWCCSPRRPA